MSANITNKNLISPENKRKSFINKLFYISCKKHDSKFNAITHLRKFKVI